jgi:glycosyltransferase involved in cell wall biosynthesis
MIVKDESLCVEKCLQSVKPFISHWVIADNGSTDNTEEVCRKTLEGIPGEFVHTTWKDFSSNRNECLELARATDCDYLLIIDADDYIEAQAGAFDNLFGSCYRIQVQHANVVHYRPHLIHKDVPAKYVGVLHEYLELPANVEQIILPNVKMIIGHGGNRSSDHFGKFGKDIDVLRRALIDEPKNARYQFYLAQSYRDNGQLDEAIHHYAKRAEMINGFREERYMSYLEVGRLTERIDEHNSDIITRAYLDAYEVNPNRAEAPYYLAKYYRSLEQLANSYVFAKLACSIAKPAEALFLEPEVYDWMRWDEAGITAYYSNDHEAGKKACKTALACTTMPNSNIARIAKNLSFYR